MSDDETQIRQVLAETVAGFRAKDAERIVAHRGRRSMARAPMRSPSLAADLRRRGGRRVIVRRAGDLISRQVRCCLRSRALASECPRHPGETENPDGGEPEEHRIPCRTCDGA